MNINLCSRANSERTASLFDSVTGNYYFRTTDKYFFPPGDYVLRITGSTHPSCSAETWITVTILDDRITFIDDTPELSIHPTDQNV